MAADIVVKDGVDSQVKTPKLPLYNRIVYGFISVVFVLVFMLGVGELALRVDTLGPVQERSVSPVRSRTWTHADPK